MSMFNDIEWEARGHEELCENNSKSVAEYERQCPRGHLSFLGLNPRKSGTELTMAYQVDIGRKQWRKCCGTLRNLVIFFSVAPLPWKKDN